MDDRSPSEEALDFVLVTAEDPIGLEGYLREKDWIRSDESVSHVTPAGEGNMNCTLRVTLRGGDGQARTIIVKQSRPWVQKYPAIAAPIERAWYEARFYQRVARTPNVATAMPRLLGYDAATYSLCLQDLVGCVDLVDAYGQADLPLDFAATWLGQLHAIAVGDRERELFQNLALRRLNHEHLFVVPFSRESPLDLDAITPGLEGCRQTLLDDGRVMQAAAALGRQYLDPDAGQRADASLLHGDLYPGSLLRGPSVDDRSSVFVIDPEFCFVGPREFDLGVLLGHAVFCGLEADHAVATLLENYPSNPTIDTQRLKRFAGIEIFRRLLGVAQLPLEADLEKKRQWMDLAKHWIV